MRPSQPDAVEVSVSRRWSGPLPPPEALQAFNEIVPDGAARIFAQFEAEGAHRREMEENEARHRQRYDFVGQVLAGMFAVGCFVVTGLAIYYRVDWLALIFGAGTITTGISAFLNKNALPRPGGKQIVQDRKPSGR